jgi:ribosomal protein S18 acetylase RimI-like enzyme
MLDKSSIEIIKADLSVPSHGNAIVTLMDEYARDPMGGGKGLSDYVKNNLISKLSQRNNCHIVLAFGVRIREASAAYGRLTPTAEASPVENRQPAGLVICFEGFSTFACQSLLNIHDAMVANDYRGRGLSKMMLEVVEKIAIDLGCCKLTLEVLEGNHIAQKAYRSFGFKGYELNPEMGKALFWEKKLW